jgi:prepilin-type N-terminal cleavage/methylation domain-containing protein
MNKIGNQKSEIKNFRAFTLIELLTVIAIIGTLAGLTLVVTKPAQAHEIHQNRPGRTQSNRNRAGQLQGPLRRVSARQYQLMRRR